MNGKKTEGRSIEIAGKKFKNGVDYLFEWFDWKKCQCACGIRIFDGIGEFSGQTIVIATDINQGNSVTNEAEHIASLIVSQQKIDSYKLVFVEHYPKRGVILETYDRVKFNWDSSRKEYTSPDWSPWTKEGVEKAIGQCLPTNIHFSAKQELA